MSRFFCLCELAVRYRLFFSSLCCAIFCCVPLLALAETPAPSPLADPSALRPEVSPASPAPVSQLLIAQAQTGESEAEEELPGTLDEELELPDTLDEELEDFLIEEWDPQKSKSLKQLLDEVFTLRVGFSQFKGQGSSRLYRAADLTFNWDRDWFRIFVQGQSRKSRLNIKLTLRDDIPEERKKDKPKEIIYRYRHSTTKLRQAYVLTRIESVALSAGKKTIAWGRFANFSPVDITTLPIQISGGSFGLTKVEARLPQTVVELNWFIQPWMELQLYHFPDLAIDPIFNSIENEGISYYEANYDKSAEDDFSYVQQKAKVPRLSSSEDNQNAIRIMFYPTWGTVGITYYDGLHQIPDNFETLVKKDSQDTTVGKFYFSAPKPKYTRNRVFGLEGEFRLGKITFQAELSRGELYSSLPLEDPFLENDIDESTELGKYQSWLVNENNGKLYTPTHHHLFAAGVSFDGDWRGDVTMYGIQTNYTDQGEKGAKLAQKAYPDEGNSLQNSPEAPILFMFFHGNKSIEFLHEGRLGFGLGLLGGASGLFGYLSQEYSDHLSWSASVEYSAGLLDLILVEFTGDLDYTIESLELGGRFSLAYSF